jgi:hypothetical protein
MNTEGHGKLAEQVGLPVLVESFRVRGFKRVPLNAFHLGNWLTDVQQLVDPVAADPAGLKDAVHEFIDDVLSACFLRENGRDVSDTPIVNLGPVVRAARAAEAEIAHAIDLLLLPPKNEPRAAAVFGAMRALFRIQGYFLFVHPTGGPAWLKPNPEYEPETGKRMDEEAYLKVFDSLFTQYYPHDHLDRPQLPEQPVNYRSDVASGPITAGATQSPDLYQYLREDIQIAAGRLAEVERNWAQAAFDYSVPPRPTDWAWNLELALLGRALHAVEDYFAHSNFVEHAIQVLGGLDLDDFPHRDIWGLRTIRWRATPADVEWEEHVVTGYFDKRDTLISLLHVFLDFFGVRLRDPAASLAAALKTARQAPDRRDALLFELQNFMYDTSELLTDWRSAMVDPNNAVAQHLRGKIPQLGIGGFVSSEVVARLTRELREYEFVRKLPPWVPPLLMNVLIVMHTAREGYTVYRLIRSLVRTVLDPRAAIKRIVQSALIDRAVDFVVFYADERIEQMLGAHRLGCHSLLAKDHAEAPLFEQGFNFAAAVHWFVISTMTRNPTNSAPRGRGGRALHVDWLELLEFFLSHPAYQLQPHRRNEYLCATITHTVPAKRPSENLLSIHALYARTACPGAEFTWRTIADANFGTGGLSPSETQRVINRIFSRGQDNRPAGNVAIRSGTRILIPKQKVPSIPAHEVSTTTWWAEVLKQKTWRVLPGYDTAVGSVGPLDPYAPRFISADQAAGRIADARQLLQKQERAYQ